MELSIKLSVENSHQHTKARTSNIPRTEYNIYGGPTPGAQQQHYGYPNTPNNNAYASSNNAGSTPGAQQFYGQPNTATNNASASGHGMNTNAFGPNPGNGNGYGVPHFAGNTPTNNAYYASGTSPFGSNPGNGNGNGFPHFVPNFNGYYSASNNGPYNNGHFAGNVNTSQSHYNAFHQSTYNP